MYEMTARLPRPADLRGGAGDQRDAVERPRRASRRRACNYGFDRVLHGEQYTEIRGARCRRAAKLTHKSKIKDIFDKGKDAVVVTAITTPTTSTARSSSTTR